MVVRPGILILLLLFIIQAPVFSSDFIDGTFWWETEPFIGGIDYPQTEEDAVKLLLEEARWVFSGMIYGFSLNYTPGDTSRGVETQFELTPLGMIPWGDPHLDVLTGWRERGRHIADIGYTLTGVYLLRREAWESNIYSQGTGDGEYSLHEGFSGRRKAFKDAIMNAVHTYYRSRMSTRPKEIRGSVALEQAPYLIIREGAYHARVRIKMDLDVIEQAVF